MNKEEALDWANKMLLAENPRAIWSDALTGVRAVIAILRYFPETQEAGEQLYKKYFVGLQAQCYYEDLIDWDIYDPDDEEYGLERFNEGWECLLNEVVKYYLPLKEAGFEFPPSILQEGLKQKQAEDEAKAAEEKAEAEANWKTNLANPVFAEALAAANSEQHKVLENWGHEYVVFDKDYKSPEELLNYVQEKINKRRYWCLKNFQDFDLDLV